MAHLNGRYAQSKYTATLKKELNEFNDRLDEERNV